LALKDKDVRQPYLKPGYELKTYMRQA